MCATFSADGEAVASASGDGTVRWWDWRRGKGQASLKGLCRVGGRQVVKQVLASQPKDQASHCLSPDHPATQPDPKHREPKPLLFMETEEA